MRQVRSLSWFDFSSAESSWRLSDALRDYQRIYHFTTGKKQAQPGKSPRQPPRCEKSADDAQRVTMITSQCADEICRNPTDFNNCAIFAAYSERTVEPY
jgi:hypothetical protein